MAEGEPDNCLSCITVNNLFSHNKQLDTDCKELRRIALILLDFHLNNTDDPTLDSMFDMLKISNVNKYKNFLDVKDFLEKK